MKIQLSCFIWIILFFIAFSVSGQDKKDVTIEDIWKKWTFYQESVDDIQSMKDGEYYTVLDNMGSKIIRYSYKTGEKTDILMDISDLQSEKISIINEYVFSPDEKNILIATNKESIYRHSYYADYYIYNLAEKKLSPVSKKGKQRIATFSPDGAKIAFVRDNNIFIKEVAKDDEYQITQDGHQNEIINGVPDWVYEEEFEFTQAYEWSPDSKFLAYMRFDESQVKTFALTYYQGAFPDKKKNALYPETVTYKYPKAGEANSLVGVRLYDLINKSTKPVDIGPEADQYIPRIKWSQTSEVLSILRLNRLQNFIEILFADPQTGLSKVVYSERDKYYIDESNFDNLIFLDDNQHFIFSSGKDGFKHLYLYDMQGKLTCQVTKGNWDVTEFIGFEPKKKLIYYQSCEESPIQRTVYTIKLDGTDKTKMSEKSGTNNISFSRNFKYYVSTFSNYLTPKIVTLYNIKGKQIKILEDNALLLENIKQFNYSNKEFFKIPTVDSFQLNSWILKPYSFNANKKYPVVITQYSGPNSQEVQDEWQFDWSQALAAKGFIVVCVDPRGTGGRGEIFRKMTYLQLGKYETIDLIETAKFLGKYDFIDKDRIGIWGWSYGGYTTLLCMTKGAEYFKAGIAVAPVTNWRYYDNIYTERFMRTPKENPFGYDSNSPLNFTDKLVGKLLICHGATDDNVHLQNSMELIEKLVQANKQFDMHIYTNRNHSIYGGNTRNHLYNLFVDFFETNLK